MKHDAIELLNKIGETRLLAQIERLSDIDAEKVLSSTSGMDIPLLLRQKALIHTPAIPPSKFSPFTKYFLAGSSVDSEKGRELIRHGKTGCIIIAGGQGTRLRFDGPKGMYPISPVKGRSLFQIFAERTLAASLRYGACLPLAIMTSPQNHLTTVQFFRDNNYFGLPEEQITFFTQKQLPMLDKEGGLFLETPTSIAQGPDGNGAALQQFYAEGPGRAWEDRGIEFINFVVIDNPLAEPFDPELFGHHARHGNDITVKCTSRVDPEEKVGVLGYNGQHLTVLEYSELPEAIRGARNPDGTLQYGCANLSLFCFSMNFIRKLSGESGSMPLHKAFKAVKYLDAAGQTVQSKDPIAWKFEKFIFDVLQNTTKVTALLYKREDCFAPLKNFSGPDSPETVTKAIEASDRRAYLMATGQQPPEGPFETDPRHYYK